MEHKIFVAEISLHYEPKQTIIHEWSRERYARELNERKKTKYNNWYFKRVTLKQANIIEGKTERKRLRKQYDIAIMEKYNVGEDYRQNRWFMEQVRPTLKW